VNQTVMLLHRTRVHCIHM